MQLTVISRCNNDTYAFACALGCDVFFNWAGRVTVVRISGYVQPWCVADYTPPAGCVTGPPAVHRPVDHSTAQSPSWNNRSCRTRSSPYHLVRTRFTYRFSLKQHESCCTTQAGPGLARQLTQIALIKVTNQTAGDHTDVLTNAYYWRHNIYEVHAWYVSYMWLHIVEYFSCRRQISARHFDPLCDLLQGRAHRNAMIFFHTWRASLWRRHKHAYDKLVYMHVVFQSLTYVCMQTWLHQRGHPHQLTAVNLDCERQNTVKWTRYLGTSLCKTSMLSALCWPAHGLSLCPRPSWAQLSTNSLSRSLLKCVH